MQCNLLLAALDQCKQMFSLLLLLASRACRSANPAIEANDLGINAAKCADTYCTSKDSLDLWLSIAKDCYSEAGD